MATTSLQELVEKSGQGDQSAFRLLVEPFEDRLFAYAFARVRTREEALDILQDVLVDLWQALPRFAYRSDEEFHGFLYTIAKRRVYAAWGKERALPLTDQDLIDQTCDKPVERLIIEDALTALDECSREIVLLRHWSRYSFAEIGSILHMEEGTVRVRHHRALKTLHDSLATYASRT